MKDTPPTPLHVQGFSFANQTATFATTTTLNADRHRITLGFRTFRTARRKVQTP